MSEEAITLLDLPAVARYKHAFKGPNYQFSYCGIESPERPDHTITLDPPDDACPVCLALCRDNQN